MKKRLRIGRKLDFTNNTDIRLEETPDEKNKRMNYMKKIKLDRKVIDKVENILRKYPFWLLRIEMGGLGSPSIYNVASGQECSTDSIVETTAEYEEYINKQVKMIERIFDLLQKEEKDIIRFTYFESNTVEEVIEMMNICKAKYYRLRKDSFMKFAIALGYIK
jgi:hypothetical protein